MWLPSESLDHGHGHCWLRFPFNTLLFVFLSCVPSCVLVSRSQRPVRPPTMSVHRVHAVRSLLSAHFVGSTVLHIRLLACRGSTVSLDQLQLSRRRWQVQRVYQKRIRLLYFGVPSHGLQLIETFLMCPSRGCGLLGSRYVLCMYTP